MALTRQQVLVSNGYLDVLGAYTSRPLTELIQNRHLLTVISNFMYYGYIPSKETLEVLNSISTYPQFLGAWWEDAEIALKRITADDRNMDDFVVYQNFPQEVLDMSLCEYWYKQILMYFGFDKELFRQEKIKRDTLFEQQTLKVLHLADSRTIAGIYSSLLENKSRWTEPQFEQVSFLMKELGVRGFTTANVAFRENGIQAINFLMDNVDGVSITVEDATDVLRLAALRSDADVSLRTTVKFKNFSRRERRALCQMLESSKHLEADMAERPQLWKLLLRRLHPGDFRCTRLSKAYNELYNGRLRSFASQVETAINRDAHVEVFRLLSQRPGEFLRRFHHLYAVFGDAAVGAFMEIMPRLTTYQLLKMVRYVQTINTRKNLVFPPRGNWNKLQIVENNKQAIRARIIGLLRDHAHNIINKRLMDLSPEGFDVDPKMEMVKLQTNDQELASYGRGTVFPIPDNITFLRTASYWENTGGTTWFDNGWNFFDENWSNKGVVCWNSTSPWNLHRRDHSLNHGAVFSGDPINSRDLKGRACQMIDLYIDRLVQQGIRYAVWNILSYNSVPFSKASGEVLATLQWGENPESGNLYEPGRAQLVFPLQGDNLTKFIAYIDLQERKLVYMDANLKGRVNSATANVESLSEQMPAFLEYLDTLPSVADLFNHVEGTIPVVYSDADREIANSAYVFRPENEANKFEQLNLARFL